MSPRAALPRRRPLPSIVSTIPARVPAVVLLLALLAGCIKGPDNGSTSGAIPPTDGPSSSSDSLRLVELASGFDAPLFVT
ncbi:MAG: hypothetical protein QOC71_1873, partial [Thermoplasmata archaeon]|nr:hypothetical protein [Thermoplasmata archaeon]